MKILTSISTGSISILLPVYSYRSVLVSDTFLNEATYRLSDTFFVEATGGTGKHTFLIYRTIVIQTYLISKIFTLQNKPQWHWNLVATLSFNILIISTI
jgi:hypothetical protein